MEIEEEGQQSVLAGRLEQILEGAKAGDASATDRLLAIVGEESVAEGDEKVKERAILEAGKLLASSGRGQELSGLLETCKPYFITIPKARTAKIVRDLLDKVAEVDGSTDVQLALCRECVAWCKQGKRTFLRQRLQAREAALLLAKEEYRPALALVNGLVREVKKLDDKQLLVEIHLVESRVHHALRNLPKAKAALTAARTASTAIYVVPSVQADIDELAGTLQSDEKDYRTAFSYFFEAFETYATLKHARAVHCLKYMLLAKIMTGKAGEVTGILSGKHAVQYQGRDVDAMRRVADAYKDRSLETLEQALREYREELEGDVMIQRHLHRLHEQLLEENLVRLIEPFSRVEIGHVAELIKLPRDRVEAKLSHMILDKRFDGTLDQGKGHLVIYDVPRADPAYSSALQVVGNLNEVVDSLYSRAHALASQ